jgi:hypothetical protein
MFNSGRLCGDYVVSVKKKAFTYLIEGIKRELSMKVLIDGFNVHHILFYTHTCINVFPTLGV